MGRSENEMSPIFESAEIFWRFQGMTGAGCVSYSYHHPIIPRETCRHPNQQYLQGGLYHLRWG